MSTSEGVCNIGGESQNTSMNMNDEIEYYHEANEITRRDAKLCLEEYAPKFNWRKTNARILDVGSGDGSVTSILSKYLPSDYEALIGSDINPKAIKFANDKYGNKKIKFIPLNIEREIPNNMINSFDHVFSFYTFHWIDNHEKSFTNIYNMLHKNGEFFSIFLGNFDLYLRFEILSKSKKWAPWMTDFSKFPSQYYDFEDPDVHITKMLKKIGYNILDVRCKQRIFYFESIEALKGIVTAVNPFNIPEDMKSDFLDDFVETTRYMQLVDETKGTVKSRYNLIVIHCSK